MTFVLPFTIWTLRGFLIGIPRELEEAAMVDGSSRVGAFVRILLPLVAPGLVATSVFAFITSWNEYIFASVLLQDQRKVSRIRAPSRRLEPRDVSALLVGHDEQPRPLVVQLRSQPSQLLRIDDVRPEEHDAADPALEPGSQLVGHGRPLKPR